MDWTVLLEVLIASGFFTLIGEGARRFWNRKRATVDAAKVLQGMSLDLLEPLHAELEETSGQVRALRTKLRDLEDEFEQVLAWSRRALLLLEQHELTVTPVPPQLRRVH